MPSINLPDSFWLDVFLNKVFCDISMLMFWNSFDLQRHIIIQGNYIMYIIFFLYSETYQWWSWLYFILLIVNYLLNNPFTSPKSYMVNSDPIYDVLKINI